jgi:hypothetical protein
VPEIHEVLDGGLSADLTLSAASHQRDASGYGLSAADVRTCLSCYLISPEDANPPCASPLKARHLSG